MIDFIYISLIFYTFLHEVLCTECTFYSGPVSYVRSCSSGCCESECCSNNFKTLAIILGTVVGCVLFLVGIVILLICCARERCFQKVSPRKSAGNENPVLTNASKAEGKDHS
ncbi:uncharacterized protein LOC134229715 [Saccostrea cucullata]|uniref:uncharacterized protein LOC134229715 n=1 Tax=Saccostrea cuccullata TaxID=36930 RepID=UPI002ED45272